MTEFLTISEAAAKLKLKPRALGNLKRKGSLKQGVHWFHKPGLLGVRFDPDALEAWVREGDGRDEPEEGILMANGFKSR